MGWGSAGVSLLFSQGPGNLTITDPRSGDPTVFPSAPGPACAGVSAYDKEERERLMARHTGTCSEERSRLGVLFNLSQGL